MGLGYPGGPEIDRLAGKGKSSAISFPRGRISGVIPGAGLSADLCFSFSGLKTSLMYFIKNQRQGCHAAEPADIAASYQEAIIDALCDRLFLAAKRHNINRVAVVGGVSLNTRLRGKMSTCGRQNNVQVIFAEPQYCMDNAAMVAGLAGVGQGIGGSKAWTVDICPNLEIGLGYDICKTSVENQ
jgi:N6-L-threonylcarbamoyladenine synthase